MKDMVTKDFNEQLIKTIKNHEDKAAQDFKKAIQKIAKKYPSIDEFFLVGAKDAVTIKRELIEKSSVGARIKPLIV